MKSNPPFPSLSLPDPFCLEYSLPSNTETIITKPSGRFALCGLTLVLRVLQTSSNITLPAAMQGGSPSDSKSQMRKQRCRGIKWLAQHHTVKWWIQGLSSMKLAGESSLTHQALVT